MPTRVSQVLNAKGSITKYWKCTEQYCEVNYINPV
jgi:hypothetical protein